MSYSRPEQNVAHSAGQRTKRSNKRAENRRRRQLERRDPENAPRKLPRQGWTL